MLVTKLKKINAIQLEVRDTKVVWFIDTVSDINELLTKVPPEADVVLVNKSEPFKEASEAEDWDLAAQKLKTESNAVLIFSAGEYRVKDVHMKGSSLDAVVHYVVETPEGSVGFFQAEPSDSFVKQYSPIDVIVGRDMAIAGVQIDLEPFYVVLATFSEDYKKKSGLSDVATVEKVNIKKIEATARDGVVNMSVCSI